MFIGGTVIIRILNRLITSRVYKVITVLLVYCLNDFINILFMEIHLYLTIFVDFFLLSRIY